MNNMPKDKWTGLVTKAQFHHCLLLLSLNPLTHFISVSLTLSSSNQVTTVDWLEAGDPL